MAPLPLPRSLALYTGAVFLAVLAGLVAWTLRRPRGAEPTDQPVPRLRDYPWMSLTTWRDRHETLVRIDPAAKAKAAVVFVGDSIIEGWDNQSFEEHFAVHHALRLGIGGDKTQHVLWRITHGELDGMRPKVLVLLIGTNNLGHDQAPPPTVAAGISQVVDTVRARLPTTRLLVLGILPSGELPSAPLRAQIAATNPLVARLDDGAAIRYLDVGRHFLAADGRIPRELMADFLHPTPKGYRILAEAIEPTLREMLAGA
jgi:lysophospholipase L1-like esterase